MEAIQLDVTDAAGIAEAVRQVKEKHGRLDILVNNAGIMLEDPRRPPSSVPLEVWRQTFDTNLFGLIAVTQAFLPLLESPFVLEREGEGMRLIAPDGTRLEFEAAPMESGSR